VNSPVVGFAGLTHLGLVSAVAAAAKGFRVVAFDPDPARAAAIEAGILPVVEPELDRLFREHHRTRLSVTADAAALATCSVVYIASDVPTDDGGVSDLRGIKALIDVVAPRLNDAAALVVINQLTPINVTFAVPEGQLAEDHSAAEVAEGLAALRDGDGERAGAAYEKLSDRWRAVRERQFSS